MAASTPLGDLSWVLWCSGLWFLIGLATGFFVHHLPLGFVGRDTWLTRLRAFEGDGRWYEHRLHIRSWKDRLPEKGDMFRGGFSKRHIRSRSTDHLQRFVAETRRAEYVHWMNLSAGPLFFLILPMWAGWVMVAFGVVVHTPFICIQRYNRARLLRTLRRRGVPDPAVLRAADLGEVAGPPWPTQPPSAELPGVADNR